MARINVYVPDELAAAAKSAGLNVSALTQQAIQQAIDAAALDTWLEGVATMSQTGVSSAAALAALDEARAELWADG